MTRQKRKRATELSGTLAHICKTFPPWYFYPVAPVPSCHSQPFQGRVEYSSTSCSSYAAQGLSARWLRDPVTSPNKRKSQTVPSGWVWSFWGFLCVCLSLSQVWLMTVLHHYKWEMMLVFQRGKAKTKSSSSWGRKRTAAAQSSSCS